MVNDALYLYVLQGLNYLGPFVALPYLLRKLGPTAYGTIAFAQALVGYVMIVTEYGFGLTATRDVAAAEGNPTAVARAYWTTVAAKLFLFACSGLAMGLIVACVPAFRRDWRVFAMCGALVVGYLAFPQWYFQGRGRLREATIAQALARLALLAAIVIVVRSAANMVAAAFLMSATPLVAAVVMLTRGQRLFPDRFYRPNPNDVRRALIDGWHLFAGYTSTAIYLQTNAFVLGVLCDKQSVAYFNLAYNTALAIQALTTPVTLSVFPRVSTLFSSDRARAWALIRRVTWLLLTPMAVACVGVAALGRYIVVIVAGRSYAPAAPILSMMAILPFMVTASTIVGPLVMVNAGLRRQLTWIYLGIGVLDVTLLAVLVPAFGVIGAAASIVFAISLGTLTMMASLGMHRDRLRSP